MSNTTIIDEFTASETFGLPAISKQRKVQLAKECATAFKAIVGDEFVVTDDAILATFETDGLTSKRQKPLLVVMPGTTDEVSQILSYLSRNGIPLVPRGAGTSLSGGAIPIADGILMPLTRFNKIIDIDFENRTVTAGAGVTNLSISKAVEGANFYYAPDPSSQMACSIGGNVGENSGGVHCLKYGLTTNNIMGVKIVTIDGEICQIGGKSPGNSGLDLMGILTGSEGLLAVTTEVTVKILPRAPCCKVMLIGFPTTTDAGDFVATVMSSGIIPAGMELMDGMTIRAVEESLAPGYPTDAEALIITEIDGSELEVADQISIIETIAKKHQAYFFKVARDAAENEVFWHGRKAAFQAVSRLANDYICMDGSIPRHMIGPVIDITQSLAAEAGLLVANVFHAGDGNLHPLILFDGNNPEEHLRAEKLGLDILRACVQAGGVITGEHGVGLEKRELMHEVFSEIELRLQKRLKCAFDPAGLLNPGKVFPTLHRCADHGWMHMSKNKAAPFPDLPRF